MTLTELRYVVAVARSGHFGRAAENCHVSQPTLSVAIRRLEEELGLALFERTRGGATPTPDGEAIIRQAQRVLAEAETLQEMAGRAQDSRHRRLRVGAIPTVGPYLFPHLIPRLRTAAPDMPLVVEEDLTDQLAHSLRAGDLDVIIVAEPFSLPGTASRVLFDEPFRVIMPADHALTRHERIDPARLAPESLLLLGSGHCFRDQVLSACPQCVDSADGGRHGDPSLRGTSLETIRHMVASGTGISIMPCTAVAGGDTDNGLLAVRPFSEPQPRRRVILVWRQSFPRQAAVQTLAEAIRACNLPGVELPTVPQTAGEATPEDPEHARVCRQPADPSLP